MGPDAVENLGTGLTSARRLQRTCVCVCHRSASRAPRIADHTSWLNAGAHARTFYDGQMAISERGAGIAMTYMCVAQVI